MPYDPRVTPAELDQCLPASIPYPAAPNEFEFALVLGGTGAAGAYTAGVVDFLVEALDCFETRFATHHAVRLKVLSTTSGGTVNGAILARTIGMALPPARSGQPAATLAQNVFYDTWVNQLQVSQGLLATEDNPVSGLNGGPIDRAAQKLVSFLGPARPPRRWVPNPLRMVLTIANLRGVPYRMDLTGGPECFASYSDFGRFAFDTGNGVRDAQHADEYLVTDAPGSAATTMSWTNFAEWAKASAAPPGVFPARPLVRLGRHYAFRGLVDYVQQPGDLYQAARLPLPVDWASLGINSDQDEVRFLAVDGGTTDNEPVLLARHALSGWLRQEPRDGVTTRRAILLVDPFSAGFSAGPSASVRLLSVAGSAIGALRGDALYETADLVLMGDPNVYSRFKVTPRRPNRPAGEKSAAAAAAAATLGFFCPAFSMHDFFLGRANCQEYLRSTFVLPMENPLFADWPAADKKPVSQGGYRIVDDAGKDCLPIIPLFDSALDLPNPIAAWPHGQFDPGTVSDAINHRVECVLKELESEVVTSQAARLALGVINGAVDRGIAGYFESMIRADLHAWGLD
jgi:hypothetical protein